MSSDSEMCTDAVGMFSESEKMRCDSERKSSDSEKTISDPALDAAGDSEEEAAVDWQRLPATALCLIFQHLDAASRVVAATVSRRWRHCCSTGSVWRTLVYDCEYVRGAAWSHPAVGWDGVRARLLCAIARHGAGVRAAAVYSIRNGADVEVLRHVATCCDGLASLSVTACDGEAATTRLCAAGVREACARNPGLRALSIVGVDLAHGPPSNRIYNVLTGRQVATLTHLTLLTPEGARHVPCLRMGAARQLTALRSLRTGLWELDEEAVRGFARCGMREMVVECDAAREDSVSVLAAHPWLWDVGRTVRVTLTGRVTDDR